MTGKNLNFAFAVAPVGTIGLSDAQLYEEVITDCRLGYSLGYDSAWMLEHHFSDYFPTPSPLMFMANLAPQFPGLGFGAAVLVAPWYNPVRLAGEIAMLSNLCSGNLYLGLGRGTAKLEYDVFDINMEEARDRFKDCYEVLKRAKNRCESCGISNKEKALEVDHIIPRTKGGKDELSNFQALCYTCNSQKSNKDDTHFKKIFDSYNHRKKGCIFCNISQSKVVKSNELAVVIKDNYPVTKHHCLIIPKRHCADYFDLYQPEINAISQLINEMKTELQKKDKTIKGFNIGNNSGEVSGQTIFHCHIHLIPRRKGDTENPRGGVRGVIKDKQNY